MRVATRQVHFAGYTVNPNEAWMEQAARNLTDAIDGFLNGMRFLLMDRDTKFCAGFRRILRNAGIVCLRLPARSPNLNAHIERFMRSLREECVDRMIFFAGGSLGRAVHSFVEHYRYERNHQGLANRIIEPGDEVGRAHGSINSRERLGGLLRYYYRDAA